MEKRWTKYLELKGDYVEKYDAYLPKNISFIKKVNDLSNYPRISTLSSLFTNKISSK